MTVGHEIAAGNTLGSGSTILGGRYRLVELVDAGDPAAGLPMLWRVGDETVDAFAKLWRDDPAYPEVKAIWTHEARSLLRLGGLPGAEEIFVRLRELGDDPNGFVVVLDGEGRQPLSMLLRDRARHGWLSDLKTASVRRKLWAGLLRVARGVAMMHAEGTLHRMLGPASVFSDLDEMCDFRLSGFEWSLRVASAGAVSDVGGAARRGVPPEMSLPAAQFSVATDWFSFGALCAEVVGGVAAQAGSDEFRGALARSPFSAFERRLVTDLMDPDPDRRMWHAPEIADSVEDIVEALSSDRSERRRPLYVGFDLTRGSELSKRIAAASGGAVPQHDLDGKMRFVTEDIGREPQVSARSQPYPHYVLHGAAINYELRRHTSGSVASWDVAICRASDTHPATPPSRVFRSHGLRIEARAASWIAENIRSVRNLCDAWDKALPLETDRKGLTEDQSLTIGLMQLTNQLETLITVAQIWPVTVVRSYLIGGRVALEITPRSSGERDELSRRLGMPSPAEQMSMLFRQDAVVARRSMEQRWVFGSEGRLSRREVDAPTRWVFDRHVRHPAGPRYVFYQPDGTRPAPTGNVYLRPADLIGSSALLHRRKKAIEDLGEHRMLLDALCDPASRKTSTSDAPRPTPAVTRLDPSKGEALAEIWRNQPIYMLQGPPGTGKTTLVATMAAELADSSPASQILVAAHSHATVDTALDEVAKALADLTGVDAPYAVRLDADRETVRRKDLGRRETAARLALDLGSSPLAAAAPPHIRDRILTLSRDGGPEGAAERTVFERLVEEGAACVFTTANSGELAHLIESRRRYDWLVVEEAGRAHAFDLALALQASHRVLMIGDQAQLAPFNSDLLDKLLQKPDEVLQALEFGARFAPSLIMPHEQRALASDKEAFSADCARWRETLLFFKTLFERCDRAGRDDGDPIARQLVHQHRMHPHIRRVVSDCFYPDLREADEAAFKFATQGDPFEVEPGCWLTSERIVFVDVPWVQRGQHAKGELTSPRYTAAVEAEVVLDALSRLRPAPGTREAGADAPTLQVLSPYRAQVNLIRQRVAAAQAEGRLPELSSFERRGGEIGATVDEFQGNQADIILVSLVRNNHAKQGHGLGFLSEGARWNVLLSRAKRKLVLVGSWDFLIGRYPRDAALMEDDPMAPLAKVMRALQASVDRREAKIVPFTQLGLGPSVVSPTSRPRRPTQQIG